MTLTVDPQGDYTRAKPLYEHAIAIDETALGPDHPGLAADLNNFAVLLSTHLGDHDQAMQLMTRCVRIQERALPADHPHLVHSKQVKAVIEAFAESQT